LIYFSISSYLCEPYKGTPLLSTPIGGKAQPPTCSVHKSHLSNCEILSPLFLKEPLSQDFGLLIKGRLRRYLQERTGRQTKKIPYESTGPLDQRYYVGKPSCQVILLYFSWYSIQEYSGGGEQLQGHSQ
jgi:hypothetical protein